MSAKKEKKQIIKEFKEITKWLQEESDSAELDLDKSSDPYEAMYYTGRADTLSTISKFLKDIFVPNLGKTNTDDEDDSSEAYHYAKGLEEALYESQEEITAIIKKIEDKQ